MKNVKIRPGFFLRFLLFALIGAAAFYFHRTGLLQKSLDWVSSFGALGPAIFVGVYAVACVFFIPSLIFTFSGGVLFGFWKGVFLSVLGTGLGSMAAFFIGRYLARGVISRKFAQNKTISKLSQAARTKGWKIILLARLSPVSPFLIGNYVFGATEIPPLHYLGASLVGTLPSAALYTYLGTFLGDLAALSAPGRVRSWQEWLFLALGLIATAVLSIFLGRFAQKALSESV